MRSICRIQLIQGHVFKDIAVGHWYKTRLGSDSCSAVVNVDFVNSQLYIVLLMKDKRL